MAHRGRRVLADQVGQRVDQLGTGIAFGMRAQRIGALARLGLDAAQRRQAAQPWPSQGSFRRMCHSCTRGLPLSVKRAIVCPPATAVSSVHSSG